MHQRLLGRLPVVFKGLNGKCNFMLIPLTQAAQTLAELHEILWVDAEWNLKGSHRRVTTIKLNSLYQGHKHILNILP